MNPRMLIVGALTLVCGISAVVLVQALRKPAGPAIERTAVVYAAADIKPGETIGAEMIELRPIPVGEVPEGAILKLADALDRAAQSPLDKGDMLREKKLTERGAGRGMAALIRPGMRAFTILTPSFSSSMAGFLLPGNRVDVLMTANSSGGPDDESGGAMTKTLIHNVEILAVHTTVNAPLANKINPDDARSVTLLVTPEDVELLELGQNKGTLHLSLRNPKDVGVAKAQPRTVADLQLFPVKPKPPAVVAAAPAPPAPAPGSMFGMLGGGEPKPEVKLEPVRLTVRTLRGTLAGADVTTILESGSGPGPGPGRSGDGARLSLTPGSATGR